MKLNKIIYSVPLAAILLAAGTGCRKSQFNINKNVNDPTDSTVTYDVVLPAALEGSAEDVSQIWAPLQRWLGYWARSGTYAPNVIEETYQITTGFGNVVWNNAYDNAYDYNIVQQKANAAGAKFYEGIARIMKAHCYQTLVDFYGNVPYSEALKGSNNPTPTYDDGIDVYKALFREIDAGIALIKSAAVTANNANKDIWRNDIMFGTGAIGDTATQKLRWYKFGNSLKLRMLIHAYAVAGINKTDEIAIIDAEGSGYLELGQDAQVQPGYKTDKPMPFFITYKTTAIGGVAVQNIFSRANEWGIDYYGGDHDPRQARLYEAGADGFRGVAYGLPPVNENAAANLAAIGPGLYRTSSSPQIVFSAAEAYFLRAEARFRGFIAGGPTAQQLTEDGILASMTWLGVPNPSQALADYLDYNAGYPDVDITAGSYPGAPVGYPVGGLSTILHQKWFALNGINTLEVWTDYRRVPYTEVASYAGASNSHFTYGPTGGYQPFGRNVGPAISVSPQLSPGTTIPIRYLYPQTEYNYNPANVGAQGTISPFTSKIFWDLN